MGQFGFSKRVLIALCLVVLGGYWVGYHSVHTIAVQREHKAAVAKQQAAAAIKAQKAAALKTKLETAWRRTLLAAPPDGNVDAALYDNATGALAHYTNTPAGTGFMMASVIKLSILETLLWQNQQKNISGLTASQRTQAVSMIENSDNDATSDLWTLIGGSKAVNGFFRQIGAANSRGSSEHWGWSVTTAPDQLSVIGQIAYPKLLSPASVAAADNLLGHVESDQRWGVSGGVPAGVAVRLKNGWLDPDETNGNGWVVGSVGYVSGGGADYTIAVLTNSNKSETRGIQTIEALSAATWAAVSAPKP